MLLLSLTERIPLALKGCSVATSLSARRQGTGHSAGAAALLPRTPCTIKIRRCHRLSRARPSGELPARPAPGSLTQSVPTSPSCVCQRPLRSRLVRGEHHLAVQKVPSLQRHAGQEGPRAGKGDLLPTVRWDEKHRQQPSGVVIAGAVAHQLIPARFS